MSNLSRLLAQLAVRHIDSVLSNERDCRLVFPGLSEAIAQDLHQALRCHFDMASDEVSKRVPVYLALDYPNSPVVPDESMGRLYYEAITSVRQGSFVAICMPKVLPKLHESIRGTGSPLRGLAFADDWPWNDRGMDSFRFRGPVLEAFLDFVDTDEVARQWAKRIILEGLLPGTSSLQDAVRVPLVLGDILGSFDSRSYPALPDPIDKFFFHCGLPRIVSRKDWSPEKYIRAVAATAKALSQYRTNNPEFRDYLVNELVLSRFAEFNPESLERFRGALNLMLYGVLSLGEGSGVLAYHGGVGNSSTSATVESWLELDIDRLMKLFGVTAGDDGNGGNQDRVHCRPVVADNHGIVSATGDRVALFEGAPLLLMVNVRINSDHFVEGHFQIRCKRHQRQLHQQHCTEPQFQCAIRIPPGEFTGVQGRINLAVQLVRIQRVVSEARVLIDVCGESRPALCVFGPQFDVLDLLEDDPDSAALESVTLTSLNPVKVYVLDSLATTDCIVTADDQALQVSSAVASGAGVDTACTVHVLADTIDIERFTGNRVDVRIECSGRGREVTLSGRGIEAGEFTLEDELRVSILLGEQSRLGRVLPFFQGCSGSALPRLADADPAIRRRSQLARVFEQEDGWKPILVDFLEAADHGPFTLEAGQCCRSAGPIQGFLSDMTPSTPFREAIKLYANSRRAVIDIVQRYVQGYAGRPDQPLYVVAPNFIEQQSETIETAISDYLRSYAVVVDLLQGGGLSQGEVFTLVHLDSVVLENSVTERTSLDLGMSLLGPWHPLVVAKRFMVQYWIWAAADQNDPLARQHRRLVSLFEYVSGFRVMPGFDADSLGVDVSFAFPTSDPGWHLAVTSWAFSSLRTSGSHSLRGVGERLRRSLGLKSSLYLADTDVWSESFVRSFQRSHPSRRHLGIRVSRDLDARLVVDACARLLVDQKERPTYLGALLPGGIHIFLEDYLGEQRQRMPWRQPTVSVYEALDDSRCYDHFHPDILLFPQHEEVRPTWLPRGTGEHLAVPRGLDRGTVFSIPLIDQTSDRHGLPISRIRENDAVDALRQSVEGHSCESGTSLVGKEFRRALASIDMLAAEIRPQRPALQRALGLPRSLHCDWTVLPGAHVDAGALATYITDNRVTDGQDRALWDYRLDIRRSVKSHFIVCKVPQSVISSLATRSLSLSGPDVTSALRDLSECGFAVGETMRSGKAAVGVLGVVAALRLSRSAWTAGEVDGRKWCTILLPVDCIADLLVAPDKGPSKRTDLLAVNLAWQSDGPANLSISALAVECKYVSTIYPVGAVHDALDQAEATYRIVSQLLSLARSESGMHGRLALCQILRFGLSLLVAQGQVTMDDEQAIFLATLSGSFDILPPIAPTLLVSTSCGATGHGVIQKLDRGWWVRLTADSWPRQRPRRSDPLIQQLSEVFPAIDWKRRDGITDPSTVDTSETLTEASPDTSFPRRATVEQTAHFATTRGGSAGRPSQSFDSGPSVLQGTLDAREQAEQIEAAPQVAVHPAFDGFVGNRAAVEALSIRLQYAEATGNRSIGSIGLFGPKSTGKTELSRRLALALKAPYLPLSETGLRDIDQLAHRMRERVHEAGTPMRVVDRQGGQMILRSPPMLVFVDEVHQLTARVQDTLLSVLEADDAVLRSSDVIIDVREVSFVIATTDWGKLREAFRSRVREVTLEPYDTQEVARILRHRLNAATQGDAAEADIDPAAAQLSEDSLVAISTAARAVPRVALDLLREIGMALRIRICEPDVDAIWEHLRKLVPCDRQGLTNRDKQYLRMVANRGPVGLKNIATGMGLDGSNVEGAIEPFLSQMGWIQRGPKGRTLTTSGKRLLARLPHSDD